MSELMSQHEGWLARHNRLMGRLERRQAATRRVAVVVVEPDELTEKEAEATLPGPTAPSDSDIEAIMSRDDKVWRNGVVAILKAYGENMRRLTSLQRDTHIINCRRDVAIYLRARGWSYPRIGKLMRRDHSSIIHLLEPTRKRDRYIAVHALEGQGADA
jgi:hypothetical protein